MLAIVDLATNATGNLTDHPNNNQTFNGLTGDPKHGSAWNHGYTVGGYDLKGAHTKAFFWGYAIGSTDLWYNKGYACGLSAKKTCGAPH